MGPTTGRPCGCAVRIHSCYRASKPGVFVMYYCFPHRHDHHLPFTRIKLILAIPSKVLTILCCTAGVCSQRWVKSADDMCIHFFAHTNAMLFPSSRCSVQLTRTDTIAHARTLACSHGKGRELQRVDDTHMGNVCYHDNGARAGPSARRAAPSSRRLAVGRWVASRTRRGRCKVVHRAKLVNEQHCACSRFMLCHPQLLITMYPPTYARALLYFALRAHANEGVPTSVEMRVSMCTCMCM
jgi:hypothetical protein